MSGLWVAEASVKSFLHLNPGKFQTTEMEPVASPFIWYAINEKLISLAYRETPNSGIRLGHQCFFGYRSAYDRPANLEGRPDGSSK